MASRGMELGGDLDNLAYASEEEMDAILKKYIATKNCRPDTALRWAMQRSLSDDRRKMIEAKYKAYYEAGTGLLDV